MLLERMIREMRLAHGASPSVVVLAIHDLRGVEEVRFVDRVSRSLERHLFGRRC